MTATSFHNIQREDSFAWVRATHWQEILKDPACLPSEIKDYLLAENAYTKNLLAPVADLEKELLAEMKARVPDQDKQVPLPHDDFFYWHQFDKGQEQPCFFRKQAGGAGELLLLDADKLHAAQDFFKLGEVAHSSDHRHFAYSADLSGGEIYDITITAIASGEVIDSIKSCSGEFVWLGEYIFYIVLDAEHRPFQIKRHRLKAAQEMDEVVFTNTDPSFFLSIEKDFSSDLLFIQAYDHDSSEVFILSPPSPPTTGDSGTLQRCKPRQSGIEYDLAFDPASDRYFILTNAADAVDFQIMTAPAQNPSAWETLIPHKEGEYILDFLLLKNYLVRLVRANGLPKLIVRRLDTQTEIAHQLSTEPHQLDWDEGFAYDTDTLRLFYSSPRQPKQTFDFNLATQKTTLLKTQAVQGGHNPDDFVCKMLYAHAKDGAAVPLSVFYHKDNPPDPNRPLWLYGYGAYGLTITPSFSTTRLSLTRRGIAFAIAHVRGGAMKGRSWYLQGKLAHKPNTFYDFIACAEHLIAENFVAKGNLIAQGGSAGGMLMGAVANLAPDLFKAIIAQVPFVDVLATMLDETLPLTPPEWLEWGNPITDKAAYERIAAYSPYDCVSQQAYPWILATSGVSDPRVGYWEATKWVAKLRLAQVGANPIALKTEMSAGHGGKSGRFASLQELASVYAFAILALRS